MMIEPLILDVPLPDGDETAKVYGVEYGKCNTLAGLLGVKSNRISDFVHAGMPFAKIKNSRFNLYPLQECQEWAEEHLTGSKTVIDCAIIDGKVHYGLARIAEHMDVHKGTVCNWVLKYGFPCIIYKGCRMFPFFECLEWANKHARKSKEEKHLIYTGGEQKAQSLCWRCGNAYAKKCSWFTDYTPVDGWDAQENRYNCGGYVGAAYNVLKCPNFTPDKPRRISVLIP